MYKRQAFTLNVISGTPNGNFEVNIENTLYTLVHGASIYFTPSNSGTSNLTINSITDLATGCMINVQEVFEITTHTTTTSSYTAEHCEGDGSSITIGADVYDENNPTGSTILENANSLGCDSVVNVTLVFNSLNVIEITENRCAGDGYELTVGTDIYNEINNNGTTVLQNVAGCDSTVNVNLSFDNIYTVNIDTSICDSQTYTCLLYTSPSPRD